ncbi:MAG: hypothetical protein IKX40_09470 [Thermoguttaceae bacterium]|nr:hypothetical protein [Clostridia bacterium]MBR5710975.1 hypothetical protein [Thermoguttaceae bacterium]
MTKPKNVLLVEPNYKNKYPPMGLMKISTYFRSRGANIRFFKGDLHLFAAELICEDLLAYLTSVFPDVYWKDYYPQLHNYIYTGDNTVLPQKDIFNDSDILDALSLYRIKYKKKDYFTNPRFDIVAITTLFTFYWKITIDTINFVKQLCKSPKGVIIGGVMSTLLPDEVFSATQIKPHIGLLTDSKVIDPRARKSVNIDELPLDYSILDEIDYTYPATNAYFAYMTRGCINKCPFCAVPKLEPEYKGYINLKDQLAKTKELFGEQRHLLLLDNNVLASPKFDNIIDEIKDCGFAKGATYEKPNEYDIAIKNLIASYNDRAFINKIIRIYQDLFNHLKTDDEKIEFMSKIENAHCLYSYTAQKQDILDLDSYIRPIYERFHKPSRVTRYVDFNQGIDSRLVTEKKMKKLSEINIRPLRIAFDHWELRDIYEKAVTIAANSGIRNLSNYLLYNFKDKPDDLYYRLQLNVELCERLNVSIYSFPMKYHPITDPNFYMNRDFIGEHWNRKYIRAIQSVLNSTKGKIGRSMSFFEEAFGKDIEEFHKILLMPETFIIYRRQFNQELRNRLNNKYSNTSGNNNDLVHEWWRKFLKLSDSQREIAEKIIKSNNFNLDNYPDINSKVRDVLKYYLIQH